MTATFEIYNSARLLIGKQGDETQNHTGRWAILNVAFWLIASVSSVVRNVRSTHENRPSSSNWLPCTEAFTREVVNNLLPIKVWRMRAENEATEAASS